MSKEEETRKVGRPSQYKEEYCEMLLEHMSQGKAIESFAWKVGVSRETLYNWFEKHPEFLYTKKVGECASFAWWEEEGQKGLYAQTHRDGESVNTSKINSTMWLYNMKCRFRKFGWCPESETAGSEEQPKAPVFKKDGD